MLAKNDLVPRCLGKLEGLWFVAGHYAIVEPHSREALAAWAFGGAALSSNSQSSQLGLGRSGCPFGVLPHSIFPSRFRGLRVATGVYFFYSQTCTMIIPQEGFVFQHLPPNTCRKFEAQTNQRAT